MKTQKKGLKKTTHSCKDELDKLKKQIDELKKTSEANLEGWKRSQADYQNLLKSSSKDREKFEKMTIVSILTQFFPVHRSLSLALEHVPEDFKESEWTRGMEQIYKQFESVLEGFGVTRIETENKRFDPEFHEALSREKQEGKKSGDIIREVSPGYLMNNETIVPAQVIVAE